MAAHFLAVAVAALLLAQVTSFVDLAHRIDSLEENLMASCEKSVRSGIASLTDKLAAGQTKAQN